MKKFILLLCAILMLIVVTNKYKEDYYIIPKDSIRIRIVPNSNSINDQLLKKEVKDNLELEIENDLKESKTLEESRIIIKNNIEKYKNSINEVIKDSSNKIDFKIDYGKHYFPEKKYKGVKYKSGFYESLLITLGKGEGNNWWCVLFPPICSLEEEKSADNVEYTTYIKEIFNKYLK